MLTINGRSTGAAFSDLERERLLKYYELVLKWNARLHLTTLTEPSQFFHRHIFESDFAETFILPSSESLWDLGTGLGIPGIPVAILRPELVVNLVESRRGKVIFLEEVISALSLTNARVVESRIESIANLPSKTCLIARAVEHMEDVVFRMVFLGTGCRQMMFLGSEELGLLFQSKVKASFRVELIPIPESDRRFVISAESST
ncbi:MAG: 16S rRNA (guanine(527)-N(7))-methyltransferase RsmG [Blastocatellia bacterium]